jgi:hypothetical protein
MSVRWFNDVCEKTNRDGKKNAGELPRQVASLLGLAHIEVINMNANNRPAPTRQAKTAGMMFCSMIGLR